MTVMNDNITKSDPRSSVAKVQRTEVLEEHMELIGHVPVDSGQLMIVDPYCMLNDEDGNQIVEEVIKNNLDDDTVEIKASVIANTGYGDGDYPVFAKRNQDGRIIELRIKLDWTFDYEEGSYLDCSKLLGLKNE
jgi:hypothetical protein